MICVDIQHQCPLSHLFGNFECGFSHLRGDISKISPSMPDFNRYEETNTVSLKELLFIVHTIGEGKWDWRC
jgi:hypothetical protein